MKPYSLNQLELTIILKMKTIISASRRTDIPAFYSQWLIQQLYQKYSDVVNPYNKKISRVDLTPENIHSIVLWSKNFVPLLKKAHLLKEYKLFFMFTLNDSTYLEPGIPTIERRFEQLDYIVKKFGAKRVFIRFDPIVFWKDRDELKNNLKSFEKILKKISSLNIYKIKTSFMNIYYKKLQNRNINFFDPNLDQKLGILTKLNKTANKYNVKIQICCNDYLCGNEKLPDIEKSSCIDAKLLSEITGVKASTRKDTSQRKECGCSFSRDIGSYSQTCNHNCVYCYANPKINKK